MEIVLNIKNSVKVLVVAFPLIAALPWVAAQATTGIPSNGSLGFTVQRDGENVGEHTIRFDNSDDSLKVEVQTSINVKLPFLGVSVYHFEHKGSELWRDGALIRLESTTDDDGEPRRLNVRREGEKLRVESNIAEHDSAANLIPASLWHPDLITRHVLLNTLDGSEMAVSVSEQANETLQVQGRAVQTRHFVVSGGLNRELWYDAKGVLVKVAFAAKDDSRIEYVLK